MRPTKINPASLEAKNPFEQTASSLQTSVASPLSSPRGSVLSDPSSPRGAIFLDPSSPRGSLFPDHSSPRGSPYPEPSTPRSSVISGTSTFRGSLAPEVFSPRRSISLTQSSRDATGQDFPLKKKGSAVKFQVPDRKKKELKYCAFHAPEASNWLCATLALLLICLVLLPLVSLMSFKVKKLEEKTNNEIHERKLQILRLSETLKHLQVGKVPACAMCPIQWVQRADLCFLFSSLKMTWQSSKSFCVERASTLAVPETREETTFLSRESTKHFYLQHGKYKYLEFWVGWDYEEFLNITVQNRSPHGLRRSQQNNHDLCIFIQNGIFASNGCHNSFYFICKKRVRFNWS